MYVVTGGLGFIGSNIISELHARGERILLVDNISEEKVQNLRGTYVGEYLQCDMFYDDLYNILGRVKGIFHQGAISSTTHPDSQEVMRKNYFCTKMLVDACISEKIPLVYASSAAVYGMGKIHYHFQENEAYEHPLNVYGFSKLMVDRYVREKLKNLDEDVPLVGLRYFNVYGPGEEHKGKMSSVAYQLWKDHKAGKSPILFDEYGGFGAGEHRRDFVHVDDVVDVNMHFMFGKPRTGIFNVGTGESRTFNELAKIVAEECPTYRPFPEGLEGKYQCFTEADLRHLRSAGGYSKQFVSLESGITKSKAAWRI